MHKTRGLVLFLPFPSQKTRGHSWSSPNLLNVTWNPTEFDTRLSFFRSIGGPIIVSDYPDTNQKERGQLIGLLHYKFRSLHFGAGGENDVLRWSNRRAGIGMDSHRFFYFLKVVFDLP